MKTLLQLLKIVTILTILISCDKEEDITPITSQKDTIQEPITPIVPLSYKFTNNTWVYDGSPSESFVFDLTEVTKIDYTGNSSKFSYKVIDNIIYFGKLNPDNQEISWKIRFKIESLSKIEVLLFDMDRNTQRTYTVNLI